MSIRLPSGPGALTERNREVLRLLERGLTNYEIATELGISLEGAKYHVREIMTRLNVESREEAVAAWRREQQPARQMRRAVLAIFAGKGGWASATVVAAGLGALAVVLALNLGGDESPPASPPEPDATATAAVSATASPTDAAGTAAPTQVAPGVQPPVVVTGLFEGEPAEASPDPIVRKLGDRPDSLFEPWDGERVLIYDTETIETHELGKGVAWDFSLDSEWVLWVDAPMSPGSSIFPVGLVTATNLKTGEERTFGNGGGARFLDAERIAIGGGSTVAYDLATGAISGDQSGLESYGMFFIHPEYRWDVALDESTGLPRGGSGRPRYRLVELATNSVVLEFDALAAAFGAPGEIVVATPAEGIDSDVQNLMTNIFIVNIATGQAEFIARSRYGQGPNWPLSATKDYVLWTDGFCSPQQGRMQLFNRRTGIITEIDDGLDGSAWGDESQRFGKLTPGGKLALGSFGASAIVDPATMQFVFTFPGMTPGATTGADRKWSPDFRYATYFRTAHGGLC